ncbi:amino acid adenylation domain-containing protein [Amycolatopsis sp. FBCC-B4732]|uniref:non-ribosomal peptide synthetase n=1 Tax=Amycolatopsis sp. FBCC-B4732 TaxID=3079339 RepID=UPI001FF36127|nr:amino acid adenylation domain-containing protein [Amycolatopsis sp. FBCC-B4732]UOX90018.1 amino acid adenylation domain-containing protein [Amycolatopsis sp. FBCC-B4732]
MFGLSASQEIVWLHEQLAPGSRAYNFTATLDLRGGLDTTALRDALGAAVERNSGLRLELVAKPGHLPVQRVREQCAPRMRVVDFSGEADPESAFAELLTTEARTPLDTFAAPLLRWCVVRLGERHHRIIHVEHHLIHDGLSLALLLREVFGGYRALLLDEEIEPLPVGSYEEHVLAQREPSAESVEFWRRELDGATFDMPLPAMSRARAERTRDGKQLRNTIDPETATALRKAAQERGHTPFAVLLGLLAELLRRHSGRSDMVIGTAVGNRPAGTETTIGMFVNTIPLRLRLDPEVTATSIVDNVMDKLFLCLSYQDVPVQTITRAAGLNSDGVDNPLFDVMFSAYDAVLPDIDVPDLEISLFEGVNTGTTRLDLDILLIPDDRRVVGSRSGPGGMILVWEFDKGRFTDAAVTELQGRLVSLLKAYLADPDAAIASLDTMPVVPAGEPDPAEDAFLDGGRHRPSESPAIVSGADHLTYGELDRRVTSLAERLRGAGVRAGQPVCVVLPRGVASVIALLACLRLSAVYCPLSPDDPPARLAHLTRGVNPALLVAGEALPLGPGTAPVAVLGEDVFPRAVPVPVIEGDAAYVIHTSGSTGKPKPVVVSRAALARHIERTIVRFELTARDRVLHFSPPVFDVALEEVLSGLHVGACLVVPHLDLPTPAELVGVLAARRVSVVNLVTSHVVTARAEMCAALADGRWSPRLIVLGGERPPVSVLRQLRNATDAAVLNVYGVTEAVVTTTAHELSEADLDTDDVPLGVELAGSHVHVLDNGRWPLPDGAVGELAIAGGVLATGYLGDGPATAARFPVVAGGRVYRTGDLGYRDAAGRLHFIGRSDNQVKLRGNRIELEEIEAVAAEELDLPGCVVVLDQAAEVPRLVGFYSGEKHLDEAAVHAKLARRLPAALVPADWERLDAMPALPSGKPDRGTLQKLAADVRPVEEAPFTETENDAMQSLVGRGWREVLGHDRFTSSSDFFRVGGHSMLLGQLAAWLEMQLGDRPPLRLLFQHTVLAKQAEAMRELVS